MFEKTRKFSDGLAAFAGDESGATAIEYALIASATALVIIPFMAAFSDAFRAEYTTITETMNNQ